MALPTLTKTYEVDPNNAGGTSVSNLEDHQKTLFALKDALTGGGEIATAPWTVPLSSDGTSAGAADYWTAYTDLVWNTAAHSWIVLECAGSVGHQLMIDLDNAAAYRVNKIGWSPSGAYVGGDINTAPTAGDEIQLIGANSAWLNNSAGNHTSKVHVSVSTDGDVTRVWVYIGNACLLLWDFEVVNDKVTGWADGVFVHLDNNTTSVALIARMGLSTYNYAEEAGVTIKQFLSYEGYGVTEEAFFIGQTTPNDFDLSNPMWPIGLWSEQAPYRGKMGNLVDIWWGLQVRADGDQYPDVPTLYQFVQVGDLILPWDSSTVMQTA